MSMGYCANCRKVLEDEQAIIYEYACYHVDVGDREKSKETYDGSIIIQKEAFVEPAIHQKIKKMPSGRKKLLIKRISNEFNFSELLIAEKIKIENCSSAWKTVDGIDFMAWKLVWKLFDEYQDTGVIAEKISWCS